MSEPNDPIYDALLTLLGRLEQGYKACQDVQARARFALCIAGGLAEAMRQWVPRDEGE